MTALIELKAPRARFARSINIERDASGSAIEGYLPFGRAVEVISRLSAVLDSPDVEAALSITGPYGSGKSSLALVIDALLGPDGDRQRASAEELLEHVAPTALSRLRSARRRLGAERRGFIRATVTAQREPIAATVLRGLIQGAERFVPAPTQRDEHRSVLSELRSQYDAYVGGGRLRPETRTIRQMVARVARLAPVLVLIDEFGKNLEALADTSSDADLFLLQELAEWTRGDKIPLTVVTLQHLAFDEYATATTSIQRREWAKIQGRFEDIPFVDSASQTHALVAAAFGEPRDPLTSAVARWAAEQVRALAGLGLKELLDTDLIGRCWPLHPVALAVLPDLCQRYGQNERTLFSFLAGHEQLSVTSFLKECAWSESDRLPTVHLPRLYDYFVESAATMVSVSSAASRWVEVDNRIRDARGISEPARRVLKTVGLLNLVSAGGALRAAKGVVEYAATDGAKGTATRAEVAKHLTDLEARGLITFRDFADEYRVWQGSDFDLRAAIDSAHHRVMEEPGARVVARALPLSPLIAGRHSHQTGTLRAFARQWIDSDASVVEPLGSTDEADGLAMYVLGPDAPKWTVERREDGKPVVFLTADESDAVLKAAREVAAIDEVLETSDAIRQDWVAYRELVERRIQARGALETAFENSYGNAQRHWTRWTYARPSKRYRWTNGEFPSSSHALSQVADLWYFQAPTIKNDLVNRHDLSSQAAKARRVLIDAMLSSSQSEDLGISGFGPDRTLYLSILKELGLHQFRGGVWKLVEPPTSSSLRPAWERLVELLHAASSERKRVTDIYETLAAPPYGVRLGVSPILLVIALLVHAEDIALYEHGTLKPVLSSEICERLTRNPANFEVKYFASRSGARAELLNAIAGVLNVAVGQTREVRRGGSVLAVLSHLVGLMNTLPEHVRRTRRISRSAQAVRNVLMTATEPDALLFKAIPEALGRRPVPASGQYGSDDMRAIALDLAVVISELSGAYPALLEEVRSALRDELRGPEDEVRKSLSARAQEIQGKIIDPNLTRLVAALAAEIPGDNEWAEYVAMNVTGRPPAAWSDEDRSRFFSLLHDIGGTFRRIEALNADVRSRDGAFDALRVTVTRPDGAEVAKVVWVDGARRAAIESIVDDAVREAMKDGASAAEAREVLLAILAERDILSEARRVDVVPFERTVGSAASWQQGG